MATGKLYGVGVGPGDPELMTLKAARILEASKVVANFAKKGKRGNARTIADSVVGEEAEELIFTYPYTTELKSSDSEYVDAMTRFYDESAETVAARLKAGLDVAVLCEGDPLFFGSYMYLHDRLAERFETEVIPGVPSVMGCAALAGKPLVSLNECLAILPGTLEADALEARLSTFEAAAIMKLGSNFAKVRDVLRKIGREDQAIYVERGTMEQQRVFPLADYAEDKAPYFSMILLPGPRLAMKEGEGE